MWSSRMWPKRHKKSHRKKRERKELSSAFQIPRDSPEPNINLPIKRRGGNADFLVSLFFAKIPPNKSSIWIICIAFLFLSELACFYFFSEKCSFSGGVGRRSRSFALNDRFARNWTHEIITPKSHWKHRRRFFLTRILLLTPMLLDKFMAAISRRAAPRK